MGRRARHFLTIFSIIILTVLPAATVQAEPIALHMVPAQQAACVSSDSLAKAGQRSAMPQGSGAFTFPKIELPDMGFPDLDPSSFDKEKEKEKLREAIRTLDEMGLSQEKLLERIRDAIRRPENRKKAGKAVEDLRERAQELIGRDKNGPDSDARKITKKVTEEVDKAADQAAEKVTEKVKEEVGKAAEEAADQVIEEVGRAAEEAVEEASRAIKKR